MGTGGLIRTMDGTPYLEKWITWGKLKQLLANCPDDWELLASPITGDLLIAQGGEGGPIYGHVDIGDETIEWEDACSDSPPFVVPSLDAGSK